MLKSMSEIAVQAETLTKHYGDSVAVDGISFTIEAGSITGLLGGTGRARPPPLE
jgi:ABC-2 type transport system ATP-binding protein